MSVLKTYGDDITSFKPSKTWQIKDGHIEGYIDGKEAVAQAIDLMLSTERFQYDTLSADYGVETIDLIGQRREFIQGDMERRIRECLAEDDRITDITDFALAFEGETANISFTATTQFGEIDVERSVTIGV